MRSTKSLAAAAALLVAVGLVSPGFAADKTSSDSAKKSGNSSSDRSDDQNQDSSRNRPGSKDDDNAQHHAALGVSLTESDGQVKVIAVLPGSPASRAGLQAGDQIRFVGEQRIRTAEGLAEEIGEYRPGSMVELSIRRDGEKKTLHARLGSQESTFSSRDRMNRNPSAQNDGYSNNDRQANRAERAAYSYGGNEDPQNVSMLSGQVRKLQQQVARLQQEVNELRADQNGSHNPNARQQDGWYRDTRRGNNVNGQSYRTTSRQQSDRDEDTGND